MIDTEVLEIQRKLILDPPKFKTAEVFAFRQFEIYGEQSYSPEGNLLIAEGKVGCIMLAGGQGTRLGFAGPKGMFPISPEDHKTLFHLFADKVAIAEKNINRSLFIAVMTSPENHHQTVDFFKKEHFFGLQESQIDFFSQKTLPILDDQGNFLRDLNGDIITGPDGNGSVFEAFIESGLKEKWQQLGIEIVNIVPVDNPLADPFDPEFMGFMKKGRYGLSVKAIFREDPKESVGVLVEKEGKLQVIEYTELNDSEKIARDDAGQLKHRCANITLLALDINEIRRVLLPLHLAHKAISHVGDDSPKRPNAWKFEKFIFDIFPLIERIGVLVYPRKKCFAPLKNLTGPDSVDTVRQALELK